MIRYASILMKHIAKDTIESLATGFKEINGEELLPALISLDTKDRVLAIEYIREMMNKSTNRLLHNLYVFFLAQNDDKEYNVELLNYLDQQEILIKKNQPIVLDKDFALNVCKYFNRVDAQIRIYGMLEMYEEAVKLAVSKKKYDLAKRYANIPNDEKQQKRLWLEVAKSILQEYRADNKTGLEILNECKLLTIGDILPFVSSVKLSTFKQDLLDSLKNYGAKIDGIKKEMSEMQKCSEGIMDQVNESQNMFLPVPGSMTCEKCKAPLLGSEKIFVFPCSHGFHKDCLLNWIQKFKMQIPTGKTEKLDRIESLSRKVNGLIMKKKEREAEMFAQREKEEENKGLFETIGNLFTRGNRNQLEEKASMEVLTSDEAEFLNATEKQIDALLSNECLLCGTLLIETLDMPFDLGDEFGWKIF